MNFNHTVVYTWPFRVDGQANQALQQAWRATAERKPLPNRQVYH
jgi:hypothetical protein